MNLKAFDNVYDVHKKQEVKIWDSFKTTLLKKVFMEELLPFLIYNTGEHKDNILFGSSISSWVEEEPVLPGRQFTRN